MAKKKAALARRAWNLLRLALLWARKGGSFRRRLKSLLSGGHSSRLRYYRERELSFDETPTFRFKMHRPRIPCISPAADFDDDNDDDNNESNIVYYPHNVDGSSDDDGLECRANGENVIDSQAEEFIARFYEQMKLQRQVSVLQYNEMLHRGTT